MEHSIFLAQLFGLYFVIVSASMLVRSQETKQFVQDFVSSPGLTYFAGIIVLIMGLLLVLFHNVWTSDWRSLISVLAWLTLLKGLLYLFFPYYPKWIAKKFANDTFYYTASGVTLVVGAYLLYIGFFTH